MKLKLKQYQYIFLILLLILIGYQIKESIKTPNIKLHSTRSFTGPRNHFVSLGYPDWGNK